MKKIYQNVQLAFKTQCSRLLPNLYVAQKTISCIPSKVHRIAAIIMFFCLTIASATSKAANYSFNPFSKTLSMQLTSPESVTVTESGTNNIFTLSTGTFSTTGIALIGNGTAAITVPTADIVNQVSISGGGASLSNTSFSGSGSLSSNVITILVNGTITTTLDFNVNSNSLILGAGAGVGSVSLPIKGAIDSIRGFANAGNFCVQNTAISTLNTANTINSNGTGSIDIKSNGNINMVGSINANGTGNIDITTIGTGNIIVRSLTSSQNVNLVSGAAIIDDGDTATKIVSNKCALTAVGGVGTIAMPINTTSNNIEAATATGDVIIANSIGLIVGNVNSTLSGIKITSASGQIQIKANGLFKIQEEVTCSGNLLLQSIGTTSDLIVEHNLANGINSTNGISSAISGRDLFFGTSNGYGYFSGMGIIATAARDITTQAVTSVQCNGTLGMTANAGRNFIIGNNLGAGSVFNNNSNGGAIAIETGIGGAFILDQGSNGGVASNGGNITITTDSIAIISGGVGTFGDLTIKPTSIGRSMDIGTKTINQLSITNAELNAVLATTITLGSASAGNLSITDAITRTSFAPNIELISGGNINFNPGAINTNGGTLKIASSVIQPITDTTDATASTVSFDGGISININGTSLGNGAGSTYTQMKVAGSVNLANSSLNFTGTHTPTVGQTFTIVENDNTDAIVNTFTGLAQGARINNFLGATNISANISYTGGSGNDVVVTINALPTAILSGGGGVCVGAPLPTVSVALTGAAPWDITYTNDTVSTTVTGITASPFNIPSAAVGVYSITALSDANGPNTVSLSTATIAVSVNPASTSTITALICAGSSYIFGADTLINAGTFTRIVPAINGCDSTITLNLIVLPQIINTDTVSACNSFTWPINNQTYTNSGVYTTSASGLFTGVVDTFVNWNNKALANGATISSNTLSNLSPASTINLQLGAISVNMSSPGQGMYVSPSLVGALDPNTPVTLTFNPPVYGVIANVFMTDQFDALLNANVTINYSNGSAVSKTVNSFTSTFGYFSAGLISSMVISSTQTSPSTFVSFNNLSIAYNPIYCSKDTLLLTINPTYADTVNAAICVGTNYVLGVDTFNTAGTYVRTLTTVNGCDSVVTLNLSIKNPTISFDTISNCSAFIWNGLNVDTSGVYVATLQNAAGCDSTANLFFTLKPTPNVDSINNQIVCSDSSIAAINFSGTEPNTIFNWTNTNNAIGLADSGKGNIASFTATNTTTAPISATITVTPTIVYSDSAVLPSGWLFFRKYIVTENSGDTLRSYQLKMIINTQALIAAGQMNSDGSDMRFGNKNATTFYNYWIDSGINTTNTIVWVKLDTLNALSAKSVFMFYGNSSALAVSNVNGTFTGPHSSTDSVSGGTAGGIGNSQRGFRFAPNEDVLVTSFGKNEPSGTTRDITLFDFTTQAILKQTQVSGPAAQYAYTSIGSPIWLTKNKDYLLQMYQASSDNYYYDNSSQIGQHLTYMDMRFCNSCTSTTFPTDILSNYHYGYPDLWYYTKQNVALAPSYQIAQPLICIGNPVTFTITVNPRVKPIFTQLIPQCPNTLFSLPTISTNGISGTWAPAVNATTTTTYTFTPITGQCADTASMQVVVKPTTFIVTNLNDAGAGSLRQAIINANASTCTPIIIDATGVTDTIKLQTALPDLNNEMTINGPSVGNLFVVRGVGAQFRIITIYSNKVTINNLNITNGNHPSQGGGIYNSGNLTLNNCIIFANTTSTAQGTGIQNDNKLKMVNCIVANNNGQGIANFGDSLVMINCTVSKNGYRGLVSYNGNIGLYNCIINDNVDADLISAGGISYFGFNNLIGINYVSNSVNGVNGNIIGGNSGFNNENDLDGTDNILRTADDGLMIVCGSAAFNTGTNINTPSLDIVGNAIFDTVKDMGSYESQ
jgi:hypothetical protein